MVSRTGSRIRLIQDFVEAGHAFLESAIWVVEGSGQILPLPARRVSDAAQGAATGSNPIQEQAMRLMLIGRATTDAAATILPGPETFAAMQECNEALLKSGIPPAAEGSPRARRERALRTTP